MDIHKPKPFHNWREFLKEYAIIVLGVATALAAEQAVEKLHNRTQATQARQNIQSEIITNINLITVRNHTEKCVSRRLDEVNELVSAISSGNVPKGPIWVGHPFMGAMNDSQYRSAIQSGATDLLPNKEQAAYATIYSEFAQYHQAELEEQAAWGDLRTLESPMPNAPAILWQLRSALQKARTQRWLMEVSEWDLRNNASAMGIKITDRGPRFTLPSACIPLHTDRTEGEKLVVQGRQARVTFDEP
ncbi:MAG: hypothetical protein JO256_07385 [Alphaproteobacteria bacterium]|nr:hypothetical protein [Alphaproteobacteria bacterium]